ncbi:DUF3857 domain-containing protein [Pontibacter sp. Tf4]|uniref:DUF3857 domain-containing protein n=1 Tax=Pontibacter sp. Tf4 TaxID=2761620 RepID=UPI001625FB90|nr:DUF3857 domain-containing protein [Pontibacter sp. Tf4]MBB6609557.1 DUF3857 domain-containing protein [Pontibacter sp. Tf4]
MKHFYPENKLRSLSVALLFLALIWQHATIAARRNVSQAPEPAWIKKLPHRTETNININEVNGGYHFLLMDQQYEVARQEVYSHSIYKITTEEGVQNSSEIRLSFDPHHEQLQFHKVIVWRNGKPIDKLNLNKVKVLQRESGMDKGIYDESLTAVLVLDDIRVGDVVEYACTIKGSNPVFGGRFFNSFNLQGYDPMDERLLRIVMPESRKLNYKLYLTDKKPAITTANGSTTYTWHLKNLPGTVVDDGTPSWYDPYPGVYLSEFNSWAEVVDWALPLYEINQKLSKPLLASIDSIKNTYGSDEDRMTAALRFVQDEVRYLGFEAGIGGFKPRPPSEVYANRFGDCKDKAQLLCAMLRQMDIKAYPALVNSNTQGHISELLPSPYAFNHCIVQVELLGGKTYWYDATISKQRGNYKNIYLPNYGKALLIKPNTKALATVTGTAADKPEVKVKETYYINDFSGDVELEVRTEYSGSEADYQRRHFSTTSIKDIGKTYLNFYANTYPEIESDVEISYEDDIYRNSFTVFEKYTIPNFWTDQAGNEQVIEAWFTPQVLRSYISQPKTSKRTMPLAIGYPVHVEQTINILLPETWNVSNDELTVEDDAFLFTKSEKYSNSGTELELTYTYKTKQDHVPAEATSQYVRKQKSMLDALSYGLTYHKGIGSKGGTAWPVAGFALIALLAAGFGAYKLYHWDPQLPENYTMGDSRSIGGWLVLVAIGLVGTPFRLVFGILSERYFDAAVWENILDTSSGVYSPALAGILTMELVVNVAYLVFSLLLIYLFFQRRSSVPRLMVIFYAANFAFIVLDYALISLMGLGTGTGADTAKEIAQAFIAAAIWVPYFNLSHRVKATFVERLHPAWRYQPEAEEVEEIVIA